MNAEKYLQVADARKYYFEFRFFWWSNNSNSCYSGKNAGLIYSAELEPKRKIRQIRNHRKNLSGGKNEITYYQTGL